MNPIIMWTGILMSRTISIMYFVMYMRFTKSVKIVKTSEV